MKKAITCLAFLCMPFILFSQNEVNDSSKILSEVVLKAFEQKVVVSVRPKYRCLGQ